MFQFTTTTVLNSLTDPVNGNDVLVYEDATNAPANWPEDVLVVLKVGKFVKDNVEAIYKTVAVDPVKESVELNFGSLTGLTAGKQYRLYIYVGLTQASQNSLYSNDFYTKGKPFSLDFVAKGTADDTVKEIVKIFKRYQIAVYGEKLFDVTSTATSKLTITAVDEFLRFRKVEVSEFDPTANHGMGEYKVPALAIGKTGVTVTAGVEGFGTYSWLLRNLRIPTAYNTEYLNTNEHEMPVPGVKYNQYTIHMCVNRGILGTNAAGDLVKSKTTHVFYVPQANTTAFEAALAKLGATAGVKQPA